MAVDLRDRRRPYGWPQDPFMVADVPGIKWFDIGSGEFHWPVMWGDHPLIGDDPCDDLPHVDRWVLVQEARHEAARRAVNSEGVTAVRHRHMMRMFAR